MAGVASNSTYIAQSHNTPPGRLMVAIQPHSDGGWTGPIVSLWIRYVTRCYDVIACPGLCTLIACCRVLLASY